LNPTLTGTALAATLLATTRLRAEFVKYILSKDGQAQTEKGDFFPITNEIHE
jgi:hypothetical protein